MLKVKFRLLRFLTLLLLLWLIMMAARMGVADIKFTHADNQLSYWIDSGNMSESSYSSAIDELSSSLRLTPNNPQYLEILANVQSRAVYRGFSGRDNFARSLENYNKSLSLKPIWPWGWSAKAYSKWRLGEIDDELWQALLMLDRVGQYNVQAHLTIVDIGLMLISNNTVYRDKALDLTMKHYRRGMENRQAIGLMNDIIERYGVEDLVSQW